MKRIIINTKQLKEAVSLTPNTPLQTSSDVVNAVNAAEKDSNINNELPTTIDIPNKAPNANRVAKVTSPYKPEDIEKAIANPNVKQVQYIPQQKNVATNSMQTNSLAESKYSKADIEQMRLNEMRRNGKVMTKKELEESFKKN